VWLFDRDNGGTYVNIPRLLQVGFTGGTGSSTIALINATDFSVPGWTQAYGILFNPKDSTLLLGGAGPSSITVAKINPSNPNTILASSTTLNGFLPFNIGIDGKYVTRDTLTSLSYVNGNTLTIISNHPNSDFGFTASMNFGVYEGKTGKWWVQLNGGSVKVLDMTAITTLATLTDPSNPNTDHTVVSGGVCVSTGGDFAVTTFANSSFGFIDLWQGVPAALSVSPSTLSSTPFPFGIYPNSGTTPQNLTVSNSGGGRSMPFVSSCPVTWLLLSPVNGDAGDAAVTVTVKLNLNDTLPAGVIGSKDGTYNTTIQINAGSAGQVTVPVTLVLSKWGIG
jgi:hypothetical protein